jgi:hypothetical protein
MLDGWAALFGFVGYVADGLTDYGFRPFQERLKLVERLRRQIAETGSDRTENFQATHEDWKQRSSEIHCGTSHASPLGEDMVLVVHHSNCS